MIVACSPRFYHLCNGKKSSPWRNACETKELRWMSRNARERQKGKGFPPLPLKPIISLPRDGGFLDHPRFFFRSPLAACTPTECSLVCCSFLRGTTVPAYRQPEHVTRWRGRGKKKGERTPVIVPTCVVTCQSKTCCNGVTLSIMTITGIALSEVFADCRNLHDA